MTTILEVFRMLREVWLGENEKRVAVVQAIMGKKMLGYAFYLMGDVLCYGNEKQYTCNLETTMPFPRSYLSQKSINKLLDLKDSTGPNFESFVLGEEGREWTIFSRQYAMCLTRGKGLPKEGQSCIGFRYDTGEVVNFREGDPLREFPLTVDMLPRLGEILTLPFPDDKFRELQERYPIPAKLYKNKTA